MWYLYQELPTEQDGLPMPLVAVDFSIPGYDPKKKVRTLALIDSGADICCFDVELLRLFGVAPEELPDPEQSLGAGGGFDAWPFPFTIEFNGITVCTKGHLYAVGDGINLLGREDFFGIFRVEFDQRGQRFRLDSY